MLLVVTGCESEAPMQTWVEKNRQSFAEFGYQGIVATCFAEGGPLEPYFAPLREESKEIVLKTIAGFALHEAALLYGGNTGSAFDDVLTRGWNSFVDIAGLPAAYRRELNETALGLMRRIGVPEHVAKLAIKHIPDLLEELGNRAPVPMAGELFRKVSEKLLGLVFAKRG